MPGLEEELARLEAELANVFSRDAEYLPEYGYSPKDEIVGLIEEDIADVRAEMQSPSFDYSPEELEEERMRLCILQGIPRYAL